MRIKKEKNYKMKQYNYVIVGDDRLFVATFASLAKKDGKKQLVIDRKNIAGNIYTEEVEKKSI